MFNNVLEISKRASKGGRVPIKIALLKIHEDATETNLNGLHWDETYINNAMDSAKMMPICAEFCDEQKETPLGHGLTGEVVNDSGIKEPVFENSETVGVIEDTSIETVSINNVDTKVLCGNGYLFNQRYPNFVKWVRNNFALGKVDTSIEIMGLETNDNKIKYLEDNPTNEFRTPTEFVFSGTAILSVQPSDSNAVVLEVAQKNNKEETIKMDEKELKALIQSTIAETNSKNDELMKQISELNSQIEEKDNTISELNATVEQVQKALDDLKKEHETYWTERDALEKELGKLKAEARIGELSSAISVFSDNEQKYAESEINAFKENPLEGNVDAIVSKIYSCIGQASKKAEEDAKVAEQNAATEIKNLDIFSEVNSTEEDSEDVNIF